MGGMKDEAKRIRTPPLFPRVHVNDTGRGGLSQTFDSHSILSLSLPPPTTSINAPLTGKPEKNQFIPSSKFENTLKSSSLHVTPARVDEKVNKKGVNYPREAAIKPNSIKENEYNFSFTSLTSLDSVQVPVVRRSETDFCSTKDPQTNIDLFLQFSTSSSKTKGVVAGSNGALNNLPFQENHLSAGLEDAGHMETQIHRRKLAGYFNNETQKKLKTVPEREQIAGIDIGSHENASENSAIDSLLGLSASSSNVVKVIGDKRFWKMRTYMINQQKIFAGQVFELHRLIMVQKMVAKSPNLVLERKLDGDNQSKMNSTHLLETAPKVKPNTEKLEPVSEYPEHIKSNLILSSLNKELVTPNPAVIKGQQPTSSPCWFPASGGNQWLVPVMSPSEGLVYKPFGGPCPPSSSFMVPVYGDDSLDTAFRFPVSPQFGFTYFSPNVSTIVEQTSPFGQLQKWSNTSSHVTQAIPFSLKKSQESNDSEVQGSTASSPPEKNKWDVLPLFPTEPTHRNAETDDNKKQPKPQLRAIKAIPHNPTSAFESAARIFRSIQEERRDSEYMIR